MSDLRQDIRTPGQKRKIIINAVIKVVISIAVILLALWLLGVFK